MVLYKALETSNYEPNHFGVETLESYLTEKVNHTYLSLF